MLGLLLAGALVSAAAAADPLNVVIVDICSARADHFGNYGYSRDTTPNMDALAKESVTFDHAMSQSSWCLPNYASLFTGHTAEVHGQYTNSPKSKLPAFETTVAEKMKEAGYDTASFSGGIYLLKAWGLTRGFDAYTDTFSTADAMPASMDTTLPDAELWAEKKRKGPFFMFMAVDDLHAPYQSDDPDKYDPGYEGVARDSDTAHVRFFRAYNGEPLAAGDPLRGKVEKFREDPRALAHMAARYDSSLNSVDRKISGLISRLKKDGLWDKTVFIVTADHGELLGEHGLLGHTESLYEPVTRVPLIVHHPGYPRSAGQRISKLVERVDIMPTVLDVAGASYDTLELQGRSLLPLFRDPQAPWRPYGFASSKRNMATMTDLNIDERVIQDERWKLHWYMYKDRYELYDLHSDPLERKDLSEENPDVVGRLSFELMKHFELSRPHAPGLPSGRAPSPPHLEIPVDNH